MKEQARKRQFLDNCNEAFDEYKENTLVSGNNDAVYQASRDFYKRIKIICSTYYGNGLFYEKTSDFSFTSCYTADDYYKFMYGLDSLYDYENRDELWFQKRGLNNPLMRVQYKSR